jgi:hypothetical protein
MSKSNVTSSPNPESRALRVVRSVNKSLDDHSYVTNRDLTNVNINYILFLARQNGRLCPCADKDCDQSPKVRVRHVYLDSQSHSAYRTVATSPRM